MKERVHLAENGLLWFEFFLDVAVLCGATPADVRRLESWLTVQDCSIVSLPVSLHMSLASGLLWDGVGWRLGRGPGYRVLKTAPMQEFSVECSFCDK